MAFDPVPGLSVFAGDKLLADIREADRLPRRDCFAGLRRYLGSPAGKLMLLTGLRRTGKTVMAKQGIAELPVDKRGQAVLLKVAQGRIVPSLPVYDLVEDLYDEGFRFFFVDESTAMLDFPAWAKEMADGPAARGCHVVLLGTDSLSMWLARREFLEGRYNEIRTTRIPYHEWRRLLERTGQRLSVEDYARFGGILDFDGVPAGTALTAEKRHSFRDATSIDT